MIFILNRTEQVINIIKNHGGVDGAPPFFDDLHIQDLNTGAETFQFTTVDINGVGRDLVIGNYVAFKDEEGIFRLFQIMSVESAHEETLYITVYCEGAGLELINKVFRKRVINACTLKRFVDTVTQETGWETGSLFLTDKSLDLDLETNSVYGTLQNNIQKFGGELSFRVELSDGRVTGKYVDVAYQRGRITGKRFEYGRDIESIRRKIDSTELFDSLMGIGRDGITFEDVTVEGIDKPLGQDFVVDKEAFERYNNKGYHVMGLFEFDTKSPEELLRQTYKELQKKKTPKIEYEIDVALLQELIGDVNARVSIGDTVGVVDNGFNPPIHLMARVTKLEKSRSDKSANKCILANFIEVRSNITDEMRKLASQLEGYVDNTVSSKFPIGGEDIMDGAVSGNHIVKDSITTQHLKAELVEAITGKFEQLEVKDADIINLVATKADITDLQVINASIENLIAKDAQIENAVIDKATILEALIDDLKANKADIGLLHAIEAEINSLKSDVAEIGVIKGDLAEIENIVNGNLSSENIQTGGITGDNLNMDTIFVTDANILNVNASKINAGEINTSKVLISSGDGGMRLVGNTQQFLDKEGNIRIQLGRDAQGDFDFYILDDGGNILFNTRGITGNAIENGLIKGDMIAEGQVGGTKINWDSFTTEFNKDTNTNKLTASKIVIDKDGQTIDVAFNTIENTVDGVKSVTETHTTQLDVQQGKINSLIQDTTIEKDGQTIKLKDQYNRTEQTVNSMKNTMSSQQTVIDQHTGQITATSNKTNELSRDLESAVSRISASETSIQRAHDNITGVSSEVTSAKSQISEINQNINGITARVGATETTVSSHTSEIQNVNNKVDNIEIGGRNLIIRNNELKDTMINPQGVLGEYVGSSTMQDYISVTEGENFAFSQIKATTGLGDDYFRYAFYSDDKQTVIIRKANSSDSFVEVVPSGAKWLRVSYRNLNKVKLEKGNKATSFEESPEDLKADVEKFANDVAIAKSELAKQEAIANADGKITEEERKRIEQAQENLNLALAKASEAETKAKDHANQVAEQKKNDAINASNGYTNNQISTVNTKINSANSEITVLKDKIETKVSQADIDKTIQEIEIGGRNLLRNSTFDKGMSFWSGNITWDTTIKKDNHNSIKIYKDNATTDVWSVARQTFSNDVKRGEKYTLSCWYYVKDRNKFTSGFSLEIKAKIKGVGDQGLGTKTISKENLVLNKWTHESVTITVQRDDIENIFAHPYIYKNGEVWLTEIKVEKGSKATDWSPAPEDVDQAIVDNIQTVTDKISTVESKLTQTTDSISASVSGLQSETQKITTNVSNINTDLTNKINSNLDTAKNFATSVANQKKDEAITGARKIQDTRNDNQSPGWYMLNYPYQTISEFKSANVIGISGTTYGILETKVPWANSSGGYPVQTFRSNNTPTYQRQGLNETTWSSWEQMENTSGSQNKVNAGIDASKDYTNAQITTVNEKVSGVESSVNILKDKISTKVSQTDVDRSIEEIKIGGRNLALQTYPKEYTAFTGKENDCQMSHEVILESLNVGDTITISFVFSYENLVTVPGRDDYFIRIQGSGNVTQWNSGSFPSYNISDRIRWGNGNSGEFLVSYKALISDDSKKNTRWYSNFRMDCIQSGRVGVKQMMIEYGTKRSAYTPAPEDTDKAIADGVRVVDEKVSNVSSELVQTKNSLTANINSLDSKTNTIESNLNGKASKQEVSEVNSRVTTLSADLNGITQRVSSTESKTQSLQTEVNGKATKSELTTTNNKVASIETNLNGITQRVGATETVTNSLTQEMNNKESLNHRVIRAKGWGNDYTSRREVWVSGHKLVHEDNRGLCILAINPITLAQTYKQFYDTFAEPEQRTTFVNKINELNNGDHLIIITSADAATLNNAEVCNALYKIGGSAPSTSVESYREAYALVGRSKLGKGNGIEMYIPKTANDQRVAEVAVKVSDTGSLLGVNSGNFGAQLDAAKEETRVVRENFTEFKQDTESFKWTVSQRSSITNIIENSAFHGDKRCWVSNTEFWTGKTSDFGFKGRNCGAIKNPNPFNNPEKYLMSYKAFRVKKNTTYTLNFKYALEWNCHSMDVFAILSNNESGDYGNAIHLYTANGGAQTNNENEECIARTFNTGNYEWVWLRFDHNGMKSGVDVHAACWLYVTEVGVYEGDVGAIKWTPKGGENYTTNFQMDGTGFKASFDDGTYASMGKDGFEWFNAQTGHTYHALSYVTSFDIPAGNPGQAFIKLPAEFTKRRKSLRWTVALRGYYYSTSGNFFPMHVHCSGKGDYEENGLIVCRIEGHCRIQNAGNSSDIQNRPVTAMLIAVA